MSAQSPPPGFQFHEKYRRYYRDFERGGNWYRQYDNENAALTSIPAKAVQTTAAQPGSVPRSVPAQPPATRDPYGARRPSIQQTPTPPVTRDPWGGRRPSAQLSYSAAPQIGPQSQTTAAIDDAPSREPWGMSQSPPTLTGNYVLEREPPKERETSRRRADPKYRERGGARREEGVEEDPPETVISRTISHQKPGHERKGQRRPSERRPSESSRTRPAQGRTSSFSKPRKSSNVDISGRLKDVSLSQAIESGDENGGTTVQTNAPLSFTSGSHGMDQSHYGSDAPPFNPTSIETSSRMQHSTYPDVSSASTLPDNASGMQHSTYSDLSSASTLPDNASGMRHSTYSDLSSASTLPDNASGMRHSTYSDLSSASTLLDSAAGMGAQYQSSMPFKTAMPTFANVGKSQPQADMGQPFYTTKDFAPQTNIQGNYGWSQNLDSRDQPFLRGPSGQLPHDSNLGDKRASGDSEGLGLKGYRIEGSHEKDEPLDKNFYKRDNGFFKVGRVFAMLWHENVGRDGTMLSLEQQPPGKGRFTMGPHQEPIYTSVRRMIVVRVGKGASWCLPISTYNRRATTKRGLNPDSHAAVHMTGTAVELAEGETGMTKEPLAVDPFQSQKLDGRSRVNFDKVYTIEHNVKVKNIGKVSDKSMPKLAGYWKMHNR